MMHLEMMTLSQLAAVVNGKVLGVDTSFTSVGTDSRNIVEGQLFVAIKGDNFDGNAYAAEAVKQGAAAALVSDENLAGFPHVLVADTRKALGELAHYWRKQHTLKLAGVTGSNGKTTVKEMLASILKAHVASTAPNAHVLATRGNLNNDIGMPLTLLGLHAQHRFAVIEMGMNHEGEIRQLTKIAAPDVAVINNAGTAHIGELGSREAIARAKGEIFEGLNEAGIAVINADDHFAEYWRGLNKNRKILSFGIKSAAQVTVTQMAADVMLLKTPQGEVQIKLQVLGEHNLYNALAAAAAAVALEVPLSAIAAGLNSFAGVQGRLQRKQGLHGAWVIDDTYNANPDSMKAALDVLSTMSGSKIFVMGDMGELGADSENMHAEIGSYAKQKNVDYLLAFGENARQAAQQFGANAQHFSTLEALLQALTGLIKQDTTVLVKGSRFMQMERVVNEIVQEKLGSTH